MRRIVAAALIAVWLLMAIGPAPVRATEKEPPEGTLARLEEIFALRARWLLTEETPPPIDPDYLTDSFKTARWALVHEKAKIDYVRTWAKNRGVQMVEAKPSLKIRMLNKTDEKVRFFVAESVALGYRYPGETHVNRFGVGSRHILDLRPGPDGRWAISMEWYSDPLGSEQERPASNEDFVVPVTAPADQVAGPGSGGYDRQKAVEYADTYCGLAAGCGNSGRYNTKYRDYSGEGGNCANFASQVLRAGGFRMGLVLRADTLIHRLVGWRASTAYRGKFKPQWTEALKAGSFPKVVQEGDLVGYQLKGEIVHVSIVTALDSRGYPMVNSHTADRYHVPFDLGWDKNTVYWLLKVW